ncbi:MAG: acyl-ACP--UDP-N-acetylglucosamine O-acyltransferase [Tepidisphaeraceae bacterium]|jgi:UDP-N-acetylglucosamine acyltransferase
MPEIHPTAIVDPHCEMADDVSIGAYSIIKAGVRIGPGTIIQENCHIHGHTVIGARCKIGPTSFLGLAPQHMKFDGEGSWLVIGDDVIVRELASAHRSINPGEENATRIGNRCMLMCASHVGHDCQVGDDVILANGAQLGGHVKLGNKVFIGGTAAVHQFVQIGRLSIIAGNEAFTHDVPPFAAVRYGGLKGYNAIGCKRSGMSPEAIAGVRGAYHCLHSHRTMPAAIAEIRMQYDHIPEVMEIVEFIAKSKRGVMPSIRFAQELTPMGEQT